MNPRIEFDFETLKANLEEIAATKPEGYCYKAGEAEIEAYKATGGDVSDSSPCFYVNVDGSPSCIFGHLLLQQHFSVEEVSSTEGYSVLAVFNLLGVKTTDKAKAFVCLTQSLQDTGVSWSESIRRAADETESATTKFKLDDYKFTTAYLDWTNLTVAL